MAGFKQNEAPWRVVTSAEFAALLKCYPRGLIADPPLGRQCPHRVFFDPIHGLEPANAIAVVDMGRRGAHFRIRTDIADWPADAR